MHRRLIELAVALAVIVSGLAIEPAAAAAPPPPTPLALTVGGANGVGRADLPGLACGKGGDGAAWHYGYETQLPPNTFTSLATDLRLNLDAHGTSNPAVLPDSPNGFLQGSESTVSLVNERGTAVLRLNDGGSCDHRTARVGRSTVKTTGEWTVTGGSGSFKTAQGHGTFKVDAAVAPGADNPWTLTLDGGGVTVGQPNLQVSVARLWWGTFGLDLVTRRPTVLIRVTNAGPGDAYAVRVTDAAPTTGGVTLLEGAPVVLGDLAAGTSTVFTTRFQLALPGPCALIVLLCRFDVGVATAMTDALDRPVTDLDSVSVSDWSAS